MVKVAQIRLIAFFVLVVCILGKSAPDLPLQNESIQFNRGKSPFKNEFIYNENGSLKKVLHIKTLKDSSDTSSSIEYFYNSDGRDSLQNILYKEKISYRRYKHYNGNGVLKKIEYIKGDSSLARYDSLFFKGDTQLTQIKTFSHSTLRYITKYAYNEEKLLSELYYEASNSGEILKQLKFYKYNSQNKISLIEHRRILGGKDLLIKTTNFQYFEGNILWQTNAYESNGERQLIDSIYYEGNPKEGLVKSYFFNSDSDLEYVNTQNFDNSNPVLGSQAQTPLQFRFNNGWVVLNARNKSPLQFYVYDVRGRSKFSRTFRGSDVYKFQLEGPLDFGLYFGIITQGKHSLKVKFSHF